MYRIQGQSADYIRLREELLRAEIDLKNQVARVAQLRRQLPKGTPVSQDYIFKEGPADLNLNSPDNFFETRLSELFAQDTSSLIIDHMMYAPNDEQGCPMCSMWADGYNAITPHILNRTNFVLIAKAPIAKLRTWAKSRHWNNLRLLSSYENSFNRDYKVETEEQYQSPALSVFTRDPDGTIYHFYTIQADLDDENWNGIDLYTPVWNLFDLLPEGRGNWMPRNRYG